MKTRKILAVAAALCSAVLASGASAGPIFSAVGGVINQGGPGFGTLTETFDQSGLSTGYTSGVTDFDTYIASGPSHTLTFAGFEWFSNSGTGAASVTYDLGADLDIDAFALWNEESAGIGILNLLISSDGINFTSLLSGLLPNNSPRNSDYLAQVFSFGAVSTRYFRMDMSGCPQAEAGTFPSCSIGEVAFRGVDEDMVAVPAPSAAVLMLLGFLSFGVGMARRNG